MSIYNKMAKWYDVMYSFYDHKSDCEYVKSIFERFSKTQPRRILDIGCGTGSHAIEFHAQGYDVVGIDISEEQVRLARTKVSSGVQGVPSFYVADMRDFDMGETFDAAVSFFGSIGYNESDRDIENSLGRIKKHLVSGGLFIFEFWNTRGVTGRKSSWHKAEKDGITVIRLDEGKFETDTNVLALTFHGYVISGKELVDEFVEEHRLRTFTPREISSILERCSFEVMGTFENLTFNPVSDTTFRAIAVAKA